MRAQNVLYHLKQVDYDKMCTIISELEILFLVDQHQSYCAEVNQTNTPAPKKVKMNKGSRKKSYFF